MKESAGRYTRIVHVGADPHSHKGAVNPPVYHASTIISPDYASYERRLEAPIVYGRSGTPTTKALERALADLEGAEDAILAPSGVAAIALVLSVYSSPGAEILLSDSVYAPARKFCEGPLREQGVRTEYYDPLDLKTLEDRVGPRTALIWMESPASQTFEVQDVPATVAIARKYGIPTAIDNTWAAGYFLQPLSLGADISIQALTKYVGGHSDLMMGAVMASGKPLERIKAHSSRFGYCVAGDDAYLALRGLRTLAVRLDRHWQNAKQVAHYLASHPQVARIMYPAHPDDLGHSTWKRDFSGASGLFGFVVAPERPEALPRFFDGLRLLGMGGSWGGYESLLIPTWPERQRSCTRWMPGGQTMRIHVGLEDPADIIGDLEAAFARWE